MPDTDLRQTPETDWAQRLKQQMERQDEPPAAAREPDDAQDELDSLLREQLSRLQTGSTATAAPAEQKPEPEPAPAAHEVWDGSVATAFAGGDGGEGGDPGRGGHDPVRGGRRGKRVRH